MLTKLYCIKCINCDVFLFSGEDILKFDVYKYWDVEDTCILLIYMIEKIGGLNICIDKNFLL